MDKATGGFGAACSTFEGGGVTPSTMASTGIASNAIIAFRFFFSNEVIAAPMPNGESILLQLTVLCKLYQKTDDRGTVGTGDRRGCQSARYSSEEACSSSFCKRGTAFRKAGR